MSSLILGIETSIKTGSLSLIKDAQEIDGWIGTSGISRSEDLLPEIKKMFIRNRLRISQLMLIAVSIGPGSFTGLRVGIATAKALALSANCRLGGVSILEAIVNEATPDHKVMTIVSAGRRLFFWQLFGQDRKAQTTTPQTGNLEALAHDLSLYNADHILIEENAVEDFQGITIEKKISENFQVVGGNLAKFIGSYSVRNNPENKEVLPLYIRPAIIIKG